MADYTILPISDAENFAAKHGWPGETKFLKKELGTEQVAVTYRKLPHGAGAKGGKGHRHKTQEEVFLVLSGRLEFKLNDEVIEVGPLTAVRVSPPVVRGVYNPHAEDADLLIISTKADDLREETEFVEDFWPED